MSEENQPLDRRAALVAGLMTSVAATSALLNENQAQAAPVEESAALAAILEQLKKAYAEAQKLKKEYYDKHIDKFNEQVEYINNSLKTARELKSVTEDIQNWSKYLQKEREYAVNFIETYFSGGNDFSTLELKEYDKRHSALSKILRSQRNIIESLEEVDRQIALISGDLPKEEKERIKDSKRVAVAFSHSRYVSDEAEIRMAALKEKEAKSLKKIESGSQDAKEKLELKNALNLASIKDQLEISNRLAIAANDLKEVELRVLSNQPVNSRFGDKPVDAETSKKAVDNMQRGSWGESLG